LDEDQHCNTAVCETPAPTVPAGFVLADQFGHGHGGDFRVGLGNAKTLEECAGMCRSSTACMSFLYYVAPTGRLVGHPGRCQLSNRSFRGNTPTGGVHPNQGEFVGIYSFAKPQYCGARTSQHEGQTTACCLDEGVTCPTGAFPVVAATPPPTPSGS
jgi:hypothetical protein